MQATCHVWASKMCSDTNSSCIRMKRLQGKEVSYHRFFSPLLPGFKQQKQHSTKLNNSSSCCSCTYMLLLHKEDKLFEKF